MENTKSPYQLRLDMLQMAKDYLDRQSDIAREAAYQSWSTAVEFARQAGQAVPTFPAEYTNMYSIDAITKMAEQFNQFVSGKK